MVEARARTVRVHIPFKKVTPYSTPFLAFTGPIHLASMAVPAMVLPHILSFNDYLQSMFTVLPEMEAPVFREINRRFSDE